MTDLILPTARGADQPGGNLDDSVYNRLLKERIIFLGSEVTDQVANRICAQLLLLAAEDSDRDRWFTAEEARDYGFIDRVITRASQAPAGAGTLS